MGIGPYLFNTFFFQAEDGIRDGHVTGVQTCALPIDGGTRLGAPPPGPRASGSSTTPSTSTGTPQTTGKRSSRPTITPSDFHINREGSRNGYTTPRDLTADPSFEREASCTT